MHIKKLYLLDTSKVKNYGKQMEDSAVYSKTSSSSDMVQDGTGTKAVVNIDELRETVLGQLKKYYGSVPKVVKGADIPNHEAKFDWAIVKPKPKDWKFMDDSAKVLADHPATWKAYPNTIEGAKKIIDMEYGEVCAAVKDSLGDEAVSHELVHLASACLLMWRKLNHAE